MKPNSSLGTCGNSLRFCSFDLLILDHIESRLVYFIDWAACCTLQTHFYRGVPRFHSSHGMITGTVKIDKILGKISARFHRGWDPNNLSITYPETLKNKKTNLKQCQSSAHFLFKQNNKIYKLLCSWPIKLSSLSFVSPLFVHFAYLFFLAHCAAMGEKQLTVGIMLLFNSKS